MVKATSITWPRMLKMRNIIITSLLLSGGGRSGLITQLTLEEFCNSEQVITAGNGPYWVAEVQEHKTSATYGPAKIVMNWTQYKWCLSYKKCRNLTPGAIAVDSPESKFFLGVNGKPVDRVAQETRRLGQSYGVSNMTPNNIRKTAATKSIASQESRIRSMVANHMLHNEATQQHYYNAAISAENACVAAQVITGLLDGSSIQTQTNSLATETNRRAAPHNCNCTINMPSTSSVGSSSDHAEHDVPSSTEVHSKKNDQKGDLDERDSDAVEADDDEEWIPPTPPRKNLKISLQKVYVPRVRALFTLNDVKEIGIKYHATRKRYNKKTCLKDIVRVMYEENNHYKKSWTLKQLYDKIRHSLTANEI